MVDSGYPTRTCYLGLHRQVRYHLDHFNRGGPPTNTRELFNRKHFGLRTVIERTFGVWKAKWRILDRKHPKYGLTKWMKLVVATMALHYFISDSHREDFDFVHWERIEEYHAHGDNVDGDTSHGDGDDDEDESPDDSSDEVVMIMLMVDILLMNQQVIELWKVYVTTLQMRWVEERSFAIVENLL